MKIAATTIASLASLIPYVAANFDVYHSGTGGVGGGSSGWVIHQDHPDCDEAGEARVWFGSSDVSGDKTGIRCEGDCLESGTIDEMEMNFGGDRHWTIYNDRNNDMIDLSGNIIGRCVPFPNHDYVCNVGPIGLFTGNRRLRCITDLYDSEDLQYVG